MIGEQLSEKLEEIEDTIWEFDSMFQCPYGFTGEGFRAGVKIFMSVMLDKMWELAQNESINQDDRIKMVEQMGNDIRKLVKTYTGIETHDLY